MTGSSNHKTAFISYSWDSDTHKAWVKLLATRLRTENGIDITLDQWEVVPGDQLPVFMERAIRENDYVLIVCTPKYKQRSDNRQGGVGYEGDIMSGEVMVHSNHRKFIPLLREGRGDNAIPSWLRGKYRIDLRGDPYSEDEYRDLTNTILGEREVAPPLKRVIKNSTSQSIRETVKPFLAYKEQPDNSFEPIRILGVIVDEVGEPQNDGTRGSALYSIPLRLSRAPSREWSDLFIKTWDRPPKFSTGHRPGIARVDKDRIVLINTTIEELKEEHRETLKIVVEETNRKIKEHVRERWQVRDRQNQVKESHQDNIRRIADEIEFD